MSKLSTIQNQIKAPKGQMNKFGGYKYRSCEDIVEAAKPILHIHGFALTLTDEVVNIGSRFYIKATAKISDGTETYSSEAWAREEETKKGMDCAQITGAASSYARKYALNGLFAIDDTKDADATNTHDKEVLNPIHDAKQMGDVDEGDKHLLRNLVYSSDLTSEERDLAITRIDLCHNYDEYQKIEARLQDRQQGIDTMVNPGQKDISKHIRKTVKA